MKIFYCGNKKKKKKHETIWTNIGTIKFDPEDNPFAEEMEKKRDEVYRKRIKEAEDDLSGKKKIENLSNQEVFELLMKSKVNHRETKFQNEDGVIHPKNIPYPEIYFIQYPEPHVLLTDLYESPEDWYKLRELIKKFAEESYLSYELGFWFSSISSAINCCEYLLKYEYLRYLYGKDKEEANKLILNSHFSLGTFLNKENNYLKELKIKTKFYNKIDYVNTMRVLLYHFNPKKAEKINKLGKTLVEKEGSISNSMIQPIVANNVYMIMIELINYFYNEKQYVKYIKECRKDWLKKRKLKSNYFEKTTKSPPK